MAETQAADPLLFCPSCGYDLRATPSDRCSECGLQLDRAALQESGFPWAHRQKIGRLTAYVRTVWRMTINSRLLAMESARPQDLNDGRSFRRVTAVVVAGSLLGISTWLVAITQGWQFVGLPSDAQSWGKLTGMPLWLLDLLTPWSAGVMVIPVCLILLAIYLTGVQQAVFRVGTMPPAYQRRSKAIAYYTGAPLAWLLVVPVCLVLMSIELLTKLTPLAIALGTAAVLLTMLALGGTLLRVGQWVYRVRHGGRGIAILAVLELAGLWLLGVILVQGLVPWCVGFAWIIIDSFR